MNVLKKDGDVKNLAIDVEAFATIEMSLFKIQPPSLERTMEMIRVSSEYKSLKGIIEQEKSRKFEGKACTFKVNLRSASAGSGSNVNDGSRSRERSFEANA